MNTQVYLGTNFRDSSAGFNRLAPTSLRLAARFELPDELATVLSAGAPILALEHVYEQLNRGSGAILEPWASEYLIGTNRSLSVGDVVVIGETAYAVAGFGFDRITTDDLLDAISRFQHGKVSA